MNTKFTKKQLLVILSLGFLYAIISFIYLDKYPSVYCDETIFTEPSLRLLQHGSFGTILFPPIAGMDITNALSGRIYLLFNSLVFFIFGYGVTQMRLQPFLAGLVVIFLTYKISQKFFSNKWISILSAITLALSHLFVMHSHLARPEMSTTMFLLLGVYLLLVFTENKSPVILFFTGLTASLSIDVHPTIGLISFILISFLTIQKFFSESIDRKLLIYGLLGIFAGCLWMFYVHIFLHPDYFFLQYRLHSESEAPPLGTRSLYAIMAPAFRRYYNFFWLGRFHRNMFLLLLFIISLLYGLFKKEKGQMTIIYITIVTIISFILFVPNTTNFYLILTYPFIIILSVKFLHDFLLSKSTYKIILSSALIVGLSALLISENAYKAQFIKSDYYGFIGKLKKYIPEKSVVMGYTGYSMGFENNVFFSDFFVYGWQYHYNGMNNKKLVGFLGHNIKELLKNEKVEYIIKDEGFCGFLNKHDFTLVSKLAESKCLL
ncbi:MAG: glycosyltransferase family 39 protein [Elusimicrobia bacterium]|nr:glycosyltransferase family 39 protein [Elusimicrobiota bacterium]